MTEKEGKERETDSGNGAESAESTPCKHVGRKSPGQAEGSSFQSLGQREAPSGRQREAEVAGYFH